MRRLERILQCSSVVVLTIGLAACGGSSDVPALPTAVSLSPDGARHMFHTFSPDGKRIAYWAPAEDVAGRSQLWVANADLSAAVKLPVTSLALVPPAWSPDGQSLLVASSEVGVAQVAIVPASGAAVRVLTKGPAVHLPVGWFRHGEGVNYYGSSAAAGFQSFVFFPATGENRPLVPSEKRPTLGAVSPDGSHIAYFVVDGSKATVWVAEGDGSHPRQLTTEGFEALEQSQEWSPDGKTLLYESTRTGHADLWAVPIDGGPARQLTHDVRDDYGGAWSADGKWIAFLSNRGRQTDVWVVPAAGGVEQRVTDTPAEELGPLQWRPGTNTLTFGVKTEEGAVWAMDVATGKERRLTPDSERVSRFHPSPDGTEMLYVVEKGGGIQDLVVSPIGGGAARVLVEGGGSVNGPDWSPDGKMIVFTSDRGGSSDIWVVAASSTGGLRQVTNWPGFEASPAWSKDSAQIYFVADKDSKLGDVWRVAAAGGEPVRVTTAGNLNGLTRLPGQPDFLVSTISTQGGQLTLTRLRPDGSSAVIWDKSTVLGFTPDASGASVVAEVEQSDGKTRSMILGTDGHSNRVILKPGETASAWSNDGQWVLYQFATGGANDLGLMKVADGTTRRLTTSPENEAGAEFTPDGKTVLFRRMKTVQRITAVDLSKILK